MTSKKQPSLQKLETHIPGFDSISCGGLPQGRSTLVCGTTGSAKTVFAVQFLAAGILVGNPSLLGPGEIEQMQGLFDHDQHPVD
jgi:RecA/RadA recombinase